MKNILLRLAYSNLWLALSAGAEVWVNCRLLGRPFEPVAAGLAVMSMFWVYTFAKTVRFDPAADALNDPERTAFLLRYRRPLIALGVACLVAGAWGAFLNSALALGLFLLPAAAGVLYDVKFLPQHWRYRRLKDITGVKGLVVAAAWTTLTVGLPLCYGGPVDGPVALVALWNFLIWFVNTTYFDMGDVEGDRAEGTQTIPVRFGYGNCRLFLTVITATACLLMGWGVVAGLLPTTAHAVNLVTLVLAYCLTRARSEASDISFECDVLLDGTYLWAALLTLV